MRVFGPVSPFPLENFILSLKFHPPLKITIRDLLFCGSSGARNEKRSRSKIWFRIESSFNIVFPHLNFFTLGALCGFHNSFVLEGYTWQQEQTFSRQKVGHGLAVHGMAKFQALKFTFQGLKFPVKSLALLVRSKNPLKFQALKFQNSAPEICRIQPPKVLKVRVFSGYFHPSDTFVPRGYAWQQEYPKDPAVLKIIWLVLYYRHTTSLLVEISCAFPPGKQGVSETLP